MAATDVSGYAAQSADANDSNFQNIVTIALMNYASSVATEASTVTNHAVRAAHLTEIFRDISGYALKYALLCVANGIVYETSTDAQILTQVGDIWTAVCNTGSTPLI